jgi:predicted nucleic acid-binding protein
MAKTVVADAGLLAAVIARKDRDHAWAVNEARQWPPPWVTCEAALSEAFFVLGPIDGKTLGNFLQRGLVKVQFDLDAEVDAVVSLMQKYVDVPMSLADACLVRMTELVADPLVLTTDSDFTIYRRHGRQIIPCEMPPRR